MHAALSSPRPALARRAAGPAGPAPRRAAAPPSLLVRRAARSAAASPAAAAEPTAAPGKLISSTEIPSFIPRTDFIQELTRWVVIEADDAKMKYGAPLRVTPFNNVDDVPWGFHLDILRDGESMATLSVGFDLTDAAKYEWVGRGEDGFPVMQGKVEVVPGKNFEIRKSCDRKIDEETRGVIRSFCSQLMQAVNKYYAFGSVHAEEL